MSVQQEVLPRVSVEVGYFRRWFHGFTVTDNLAVTAVRLHRRSASRRRSIARLPGGGGYTISGLYDVNPNVASSVEQLHDLVEQLRQPVPALERRGRQLQRARAAGADVPGRHEHRPDRDRQLRDQGASCRRLGPVATRTATRPPDSARSAAGLAAYTIPKIDVQVSGTFQSNPGRVAVGELHGDEPRSRRSRSAGRCRQRAERDGEPPRRRHACSAIGSTSSTSAWRRC